MVYREKELMHFGIQGMKWGVRRYQNEDGTLTEAGRKRYAGDVERADKRLKNREKYLTKKSNQIKYAGALGTMPNLLLSANRNKNQQKRISDIRKMTKDIEADPDKKAALGRHTLKQRVSTIVGGSAASAGAAFIAYAATEELLISAFPPAAVAAGAAYIYHLTKR